jgi:hypothetical protein
MPSAKRMAWERRGERDAMHLESYYDLAASLVKNGAAGKHEAAY